MLKIFHPDTVDEFIYEYVEPHTERLAMLISEAKRLGDLKTYPRRPFE